MLARYSASPVTVGEPAPRLYVLSLFSNSPPCIIRLKPAGTTSFILYTVDSTVQALIVRLHTGLRSKHSLPRLLSFGRSGTSTPIGRTGLCLLQRLPIERELATLHIAKWARLGLWSARPRSRLATPRNSTELSFGLTNKPAGLDFVLWALRSSF